ncbi:lymphocyte function-associated antigen 3 [Antechinus flavipes]|uniref:lymphocyte function-associated antigen 3 n=1 Tax=Antechinus flavipes TaxID=38775 RepID=UPI00223617C9|nr:lymphocyte function-associated antigen 3 [Antechinus flavipes]
MATNFWKAKILLASVLIGYFDFGKCESMKIFGCKNDNVTLSPFHLNIENLNNWIFKDITWKKDKDKVADWQLDEEVKYFTPFTNRATLDFKSGNLTISNLTRSDEGAYKIESLNLPEGEAVNLYVLDKLSPPTLSCSFEDGKIVVSSERPEDSRFLNYKWKYAGPYVNISESEVQINNSVDFHESISCILSNPVSTTESELFLQSCVPKENQRRHRYILIGSITVVIVICLGILFILRKCGLLNKK